MRGRRSSRQNIPDLIRLILIFFTWSSLAGVSIGRAEDEPNSAQSLGQPAPSPIDLDPLILLDQPDSTPTDSTTVTVPDSLPPAEPVVRYWWHDRWLIGEMGGAGGETLLTREELFASSGLMLSNSIGSETRLGEFQAGNQGIGNLIYQYGPALERPSYWYQGQATSGAAIPEGYSHTLSPLSVGELRWINPDPILDPLSQSGDGMLYATKDELTWDDVPSGFRAIEGRNSTSAEEACLARESGPWRLFTSLAHMSSAGRAVYLNSKYEHIQLQLERSTALGPVRISGVTRGGRYKMSESRKQNWGADFLELGWQYFLPRGGTGEARLIRRNDLLRWWDGEDEGRRWSQSTGLSFQQVLPLGRLRLLSSQAVDWTSLSFRANSDFEKIGARFGSGFAVGAVYETERTTASVSLGRTNPWNDTAHTRGRLLLSINISNALSTAIEGWRGGALIFDPALEPRGMSLIRQGIRLPDGQSILNEQQRRISHLEWRVKLHWWRLSGTAGLFTREVENALGLDRATAFEASSVLGGARYNGVVSSWHLDLPLQTFCAGDFTGIFDPAVDELPALMPPWRGRTVFGLRKRFFKDELDIELRLVGEYQGEWLTPEGIMPSTNRYDGELHARIGPVHILIDLMNLENDIRESATYDGVWIMKPLRAYRTGIEWHFKD
jgi:hypothetical protein